jgi:hypothetical protein
MGVNLMDAGRSRAVVTQALESTRQRLKRDDLRARLRQFIEG